MAKITQTELFRFENFDGNVNQKKVGNNRTVTHWECARDLSGCAENEIVRTIVGALHGSNVFELSEITTHQYSGADVRYTLRLSHCGHPTATTRQAIADFLAAAGIRASVSMAGGELNAWFVFKDGAHHKMQSGGSIIKAKLTPKDWRELTDLGELA